MIWSIAWKNVWRNKTRSLVVITAFTIGIFAGVYIVAVMVGMMDTRLELAIGNEASHIQVHHPGYLENNELQYTLENYHSTLQQIEAIPGVSAATSRSTPGASMGGMFSTPPCVKPVGVSVCASTATPACITRDSAW